MLCLFPRQHTITHTIFWFWCLVFLFGRSKICEDQGNVACDCKWMWDFSVFSVVWNSLFMRGRQKHTNTFPYCIHYVFACLIWRVSWHFCSGERRGNLFHYQTEHLSVLIWTRQEGWMACLVSFHKKWEHSLQSVTILFVCLPNKGVKLYFLTVYHLVDKDTALSMSSLVTELDYCSARGVKTQSIPQN